MRSGYWIVLALATVAVAVALVASQVMRPPLPPPSTMDGGGG